MPQSLKRLLNVVDGEDFQASASSNPVCSMSTDHSLGYWSDYNGDHPRQSDLLGPSPMKSPAHRPEIALNYEPWTQESTESAERTQNFSHFLDIDGGLSMAEFLGPMVSQQLQTSTEDGIDVSLGSQLAGSESVHFSQLNFHYDPDSSQTSTPPLQHGFQSPSVGLVSSQTSGSVTTVEDDESVCYGMLYGVDVKLVVGDMAAVDAKLCETQEDHQHFKLWEKQGHIRLRFPDDTDDDGDGFACLRTAESTTLKQVRSRQGVILDSVVGKTKLRQMIERASKPADAIVKVAICVYGPRREAPGVGDDLSAGKMWLQEPEEAYVKDGAVYENPHFLHLEVNDKGEEPVVMVNTDLDSNGVQRRRKREEQMRKMVQEVYRSVENSRNLDRVDGGSRVTNKLLSHQQEALGFMLERESGHINERYRLWEQITVDGKEEYKHKVTGATTSITPEEKGGGILADVMGMGKSLSILALTMKTLDEGKAWADQLNDGRKRKDPIQYSGSTLIVVASGLLITNWKTEIDTHLKGGLNVIKYHGRRRPKNLDTIRNSDIVLTTYKTLAVEYEISKENKEETSVLHQIGWYRVVLDEAHIIRRPTGTFYKSCRALHANSRWCLTGTPIQNKFADIGTLFSFISATPFDNASTFRRWIVTPFEEMNVDSETITKRLITLLSALCLRRTRDILHLPGVLYDVRELEFSPEERTKYDQVRRRLLRLVQHAVGVEEEFARTSLFHVNLVLRICCNHGTFQKNLAWNRQTYMDTVAGALGPSGEVKCSGCPQPMPILGSGSGTSGFGDSCVHIFCSDCVNEINAERSGVQPQWCPLCATGPAGETPGRYRPAGIKRGLGIGATAEDNHDSYFHSNGCSTKMRKIIEDVKVDIWRSKSIIFSCWTRTLDLLALHLTQAGIPYLRIDGNCPDAQRQARLNKFKDNEDSPVLIMTTGTGALGINVTCANRIFIVELQWNPSVEHQAIARATRLGQERSVRVIRYLIRNTVEEDMQQQQQHKKQIAAIGFNEVPDA
ncbi:related to helicase-like transcription factor protein [Cephalotrichum gorgonifer]|uniref:Related to helicase-like transcription factor protein n=1 Tax=Cephalotrichum gorgonifer TaxID=2041049 RepID=A0AAE8SXE6_9PEZI|nr:related to helicase-like transcription factor protein [Cephalotrichum gorgonifer]